MSVKKNLLDSYLFGLCVVIAFCLDTSIVIFDNFFNKLFSLSQIVIIFYTCIHKIEQIN